MPNLLWGGRVTDLSVSPQRSLMQSSPNPLGRRTLVIAIGVLLLLGAGVALIYETNATTSSTDAKVSSLNSIISSQSQQISSLLNSSGTLTLTTTVTSVVSTTITVSGGSTLSTSSTSSTSTTTKSTSSSSASSGSSTSSSSSSTTASSSSTTTSSSSLSTSSTTSDQARFDGDFAVPSGNGSGTLSLSVTNTGQNAIVDISLTIPTGSDPTMDVCSSTCVVQLTYDGDSITMSNPLPGGSAAIGTLSTDQGLAGKSYEFSVTVTYQDGVQQDIPLTLVAHQ